VWMYNGGRTDIGLTRLVFVSNDTNNFASYSVQVFNMPQLPTWSSDWVSISCLVNATLWYHIRYNWATVSASTPASYTSFIIDIADDSNPVYLNWTIDGSAIPVSGNRVPLRAGCSDNSLWGWDGYNQELWSISLNYIRSKPSNLTVSSTTLITATSSDPCSVSCSLIGPNQSSQYTVSKPVQSSSFTLPNTSVHNAQISPTQSLVPTMSDSFGSRPTTTLPYVGVGSSSASIITLQTSQTIASNALQSSLEVQSTLNSSPTIINANANTVRGSFVIYVSIGSSLAAVFLLAGSFILYRRSARRKRASSSLNHTIVTERQLRRNFTGITDILSSSRSALVKSSMNELTFVNDDLPRF